MENKTEETQNGNGTEAIINKQDTVSHEGMITLTEVEKLKFTNLELQKKNIKLQQAMIDTAQNELIQIIMNRTGINITGEHMNLDTGVVTLSSNHQQVVQ